MLPALSLHPIIPAHFRVGNSDFTKVDGHEHRRRRWIWQKAKEIPNCTCLQLEIAPCSTPQVPAIETGGDGVRNPGFRGTTFQNGHFSLHSPEYHPLPPVAQMSNGWRTPR